MYKYGLIMGLVVILFSCDNLNTDLPETNIAKYTIPGGFFFPEGTATVDVYNCLMSQNVSNNAERTVATDSQYSIAHHISGLDTVVDHTRDIKKISVAYSEKDPQVHEYVITLIFDDDSTNFYSDVGSAKTKLDCIFYYTWQRQTTNVWKNDKLAGELTIML